MGASCGEGGVASLPYRWQRWHTAQLRASAGSPNSALGWHRQSPRSPAHFHVPDGVRQENSSLPLPYTRSQKTVQHKKTLLLNHVVGYLTKQRTPSQPEAGPRQPEKTWNLHRCSALTGRCAS